MAYQLNRKRQNKPNVKSETNEINLMKQYTKKKKPIQTKTKNNCHKYTEALKKIETRNNNTHNSI